MDTEASLKVAEQELQDRREADLKRVLTHRRVFWVTMAPLLWIWFQSLSIVAEIDGVPWFFWGLMVVFVLLWVWKFRALNGEVEEARRDLIEVAPDSPLLPPQ